MILNDTINILDHAPYFLARFYSNVINAPSGDVTYTAPCSTAAATGSKVATVSGLTFTKNTRLVLTFSNPATSISALNINGTTKSTNRYNAFPYVLSAEFVYDGSQWVFASEVEAPKSSYIYSFIFYKSGIFLYGSGVLSSDRVYSNFGNGTWLGEASASTLASFINTAGATSSANMMPACGTVNGKQVIGAYCTSSSSPSYVNAVLADGTTSAMPFDTATTTRVMFMPVRSV